MDSITPPNGMRRRHAVAALLLLLPAAPAAALGPEPDPRRATYLEYSRNLVAAYPEALARRIRDLRQQARTEPSDAELCRRAVRAVPEHLEPNPHRRIALVGAGELGRRPDRWERHALAEMDAGGERERHAFVRMETEGEGAAREVFRYLGRLERLPAPCDRQSEPVAGGPAVSILRLAGAGGDPRVLPPRGAEPVLRLPHRQAPGRPR